MWTRKLPARLIRVGLFVFAIGLPFSHVPAQFGIAIAGFGWVAEGVFNKNWLTRKDALFIPLVGYLVWNLGASLLSPRQLHSVLALFDNEWPVCIMLLLFWTVRDMTTLVRIVYAFLLASSIAMAYGIWQTFAGVDLVRGVSLTPFEGYFRAVGFHGFYLTFAGFAMCVFFLSLGFLVERKGGARWSFIAATTLSFLAVVATFARSIWLSFAAAIPLFGFARGRRAGVLLTVSLALIVSAAVFTVPALQSRMASIVDLAENKTRINLWRTAINIWSAYPITGVGEDNWDYFFPLYKVESYYDSVVHPHNDYLNVLVSSGIPGLFCFLAMWWMVVATGLRTIRTSLEPPIRAIAMGSTYSVVGFLVASLFQNYYGTFINCLLWWFLVGLLFSAQALDRTETS